MEGCLCSPRLAQSVAGMAGHVGYRKCPTLSSALRSYLFYLWLCWPRLQYFGEQMEVKRTALRGVFSSAASAKLKNNTLIREMLEMERGELQPDEI